jgi:hypothetical protein
MRLCLHLASSKRRRSAQLAARLRAAEAATSIPDRWHLLEIQ